MNKLIRASGLECTKIEIVKQAVIVFLSHPKYKASTTPGKEIVALANELERFVKQ